MAKRVQLTSSLSTKDAVRSIVDSRPGQWSVAELEAELRRHGWRRRRGGPDRALLVLAVQRLAAGGEAHRVRSNVFRFDAGR